VIDALNARDLAAQVARLVGGGVPHRRVVCVPASRPERNLPVDVWRQMRQRSDGSAAQIFARYAGRIFSFVVDD